MFLDTSVVVAAFRREQTILQQLANVQGTVSATVLGELYHGALRATFTAREMGFITQLIATSVVVDCDTVTAAHYGNIRYALQQQGTPIPENDVWIAASALQYGIPLVTRDGHFNNVPGLAVEQW